MENRGKVAFYENSVNLMVIRRFWEMSVDFLACLILECFTYFRDYIVGICHGNKVNRVAFGIEEISDLTQVGLSKATS